MSDKCFAVLWVFLLSLCALPAMAAQSCNNTVTQTAPNSRYVDPGASKAQCWGSNTNGQLGNGTATDSPSPVNVSGIRTAMTLGAGHDHSCSLLVDGTVQCWGMNAYGQLGDGTTTDSFTPVSVSGLTNVASLAVGSEHSCARLADGTVQCWGLNSDGQLGNGNTVDSPIPVPVTGITTAVAVAAGDSHSCAALTDGSVWCWGRNDNGRLGNNSIIAAWTPVQVCGVGPNVNLGGVGASCPSGTLATAKATAVAAGGSHSCARLEDGKVRCWGLNSSGQLGDGTTNESHTAVYVNVNEIGTATAIAVGNAHSCALLSDYNVRCWGQNNYGQLGNGLTANPTTTVMVSGITDAVEITASGDHSCARLSDVSDGKIECWGLNADGQLGNGSTVNSALPVFVSGIIKAAAIAAGSTHSCARLSIGTGTLLDTSTGLMWKRCSEGQAWDAVKEACVGVATPYTWQAALQRAKDVNGGSIGENLGHSHWRLPNRNELASLLEQQCSSPAINAALFPSTVAAPYWSSSPDAGVAQQAWSVNFNDGRVAGAAKTGSAYVRLVRGGQ
jgi:alpha-tubulin suppressor-like RCC1 family protein